MITELAHVSQGQPFTVVERDGRGRGPGRPVVEQPSLAQKINNREAKLGKKVANRH